MSTTYDRMRAAAAEIEHMRDLCSDGFAILRTNMANDLRADADRLQAVEREMREQFDCPAPDDVERWADRIRGEGK